MKTIALRMVGQFGNQLFQYAHARAYAERHDCMLYTPAWDGQRIFREVTEAPWEGEDLPERSCLDLGDRQVNITITGFAQHQSCVIYTRQQVRRWFRFTQEIQHELKMATQPDAHVISLRRGDYLLWGFPVLKRESYHKAIAKFGYDPAGFIEVSGEPNIPWLGAFVYLADFYQLLRAKVLFRSNSTFAWWAATLGEPRVYSPVINGLGAGEHEVDFVEGNWPRCVDAAHTSDLVIS